MKKIKNCLFYYLAFNFIHPSFGKAPEFFQVALFWNIGQGQWLTVVDPDTCLHFDFGGEKQFTKKIDPFFQRICRLRKNKLFLSHPDLDHYFHVSYITKTAFDVCWAGVDIPDVIIRKKINLNFCKDQNNLPLYFGSEGIKTKDKNRLSKVYLFKNLLIPGDSTQKDEAFWAQIKQTTQTQFLLLGHHGSRTSTGDFLLSKLPNLKMAFVQSRYAKYHHPHAEVVMRLQKIKTPLIRTEQWGHISLRLN